MRGNVKGGTITLNLHSNFVSLQVRELKDGTLVFPGGSIALVEGEIRGGILWKTRKLFFKGESLEDFDVVPKVYSSTILPPYRGIRIDDFWKVRLYEPETFDISKKDYEKGRTKIQGIYYRIEDTVGNLIKLIPTSNTSVKDDYHLYG